MSLTEAYESRTKEPEKVGMKKGLESPYGNLRIWGERNCREPLQKLLIGERCRGLETLRNFP